jgi:hypothetical protein
MIIISNGEHVLRNGMSVEGIETCCFETTGTVFN